LDAASQLRRLMTRSHLDEVAARARITSQMDLERKRELATWVVHNSGSLSSTRGQVERLWTDHLGAPETPPR
ncbi:MAG: dephospho-CoA kinase, partial [Acidimicrobiales bacterium]